MGFRDHKDMVWNLSKEGRKELALDYLEKDYKDTVSTFAGNKGIIEFNKEYIEKRLEKLQEGVDLEGYSRYSELDRILTEFKEIFEYSYVEDKLDNGESANYLGKIDINGKEFSILEQNGIGGCLVRDMKIKDLKEGEEVMAINQIDKKGNEVMSLVKDEGYGIDI